MLCCLLYNFHPSFGVMLKLLKDLRHNRRPNGSTAFSDCEPLALVHSKEEGGRHTGFGDNYRPQIYLRTAGECLTLSAPPFSLLLIPSVYMEGKVLR